jgi:hypothetical protein
VAVDHTVVGLGIHRDHLGAVAAGHTDLVEVAVGRNLVEVHRSLEVGADQGEHHNLVVAVDRNPAGAVDHNLAEAVDHNLAEARHTDRVVHRSRQAPGCSSRPWSRSFGQWHQEAA